MDRDRFVVSDEVCEKVAPLLHGKASDGGVTAKDNRVFVEAVLWRVRTGPEASGGLREVPPGGRPQVAGV